MRKFSSSLPLMAVVTGVVTTLSGQAFATNGMLPSCVGTDRCGMGGAGSAMPSAATDAIINHAAGAFLDSQYSLNLGWFWADVKTRTKGNWTLIGAGTNTTGPAQTSAADNFPNGSIGVNYRVDEKLALNLTIAPGGGGASKWGTSALTGATAVAATNHQEVTYEMTYISPSVSYKRNEKESYGAGLILSSATMMTDAVSTKFVASANPNKKEQFYGIGAQLGGIWQVNDKASASLNYRSPVWHQHSGQYNNLIFNSPIDTPQQITAGIAYKYAPVTKLALDVKWVDWDGTETIGKGPGTTPSGFGWNDQTIIMLGLEHQLNEATTLRAGYNYGKSPIDSEHVFANVIFPAIVEHHFTVGGSYYLPNGIELGVSAYYAPKTTLTDSGAGDAFSQVGNGTTLSHAQRGFQLSLTRAF